MSGAHDLGGRRGFGAIDRSSDVQFAHAWERKVFALTLACGMLGRWNLDQSRAAREAMDDAAYLASSYYEHWLHGLEKLLRERGMISDAELRSGHASADDDGAHESCAVDATRVAQILAVGAPTEIASDAPPRFNIGAAIIVREDAPPRGVHTRAPGYARGRVGRIVHHHGAHIFPDRHAADGTRAAQHLYSVRFEAKTLWGDDAGARRAAVYIDLFEPYLRAAHDGDDADA